MTRLMGQQGYRNQGKAARGFSTNRTAFKSGFRPWSSAKCASSFAFLKSSSRPTLGCSAALFHRSGTQIHEYCSDAKS